MVRYFVQNKNISASLGLPKAVAEQQQQHHLYQMSVDFSLDFDQHFTAGLFLHLKNDGVRKGILTFHQRKITSTMFLFNNL